MFTGIMKVPAYILPKPTEVFGALLQSFLDKILPAAGMTLFVVLVGFVIGVPIGLLVAAVTSQIEVLNKALSPMVIFLVCTPLISLVPLFMMWMGYGANVRIIAVILQVFPIVMMNAFTGFNNVEKIKLELMQSLGASKLVTFVRVILPDALPHVFTGVKLGTIFATITAISTEVVSGNQGLGNLMMQAKGVLRTDLVLAAIVVCAVIGILLYTIVGAVERKIIRWTI